MIYILISIQTFLEFVFLNQKKTFICVLYKKSQLLLHVPIICLCPGSSIYRGRGVGMQDHQALVQCSAA